MCHRSSFHWPFDMTKSNAEEFILLLCDGQTGFTGLGAAGNGQPKLYPLFNVCLVATKQKERERQKKKKRKKTLKLGSEK